MEDHHWLVHLPLSNTLNCNICIKAGVVSSWTKNPGCTSVRIDKITEHAESKKHTNAVTTLADLEANSTSSATATGETKTAQPKQPTAKSLFQKLQQEAKSTLIRRLQVIYDLAKRKRPISDFKAQLHLLNFLDAPGLSLNSLFPANVSYDSSTFVQEALSAICAYLWEKQLEIISESPTISLFIDESTDIANISELIIFIAGIVDGKSFCHFADILPLEAGNAQHITQTLLEWMNRNSKIDWSKFSAIGTDGASTLTGKDDGLSC